MWFDLMLKASCSICGSTSDLYGSNCKHLTLCSSCGKSMAENRGKCYECGAVLTHLIRDGDGEEEGEGKEEGGLSKSGKELKRLLGRPNGLNNSDADEEDDGSGKRKKEEADDDDDEDEDGPSPGLAPKLKDAIEEPADNSPAKPVPGRSSHGTPSKSAKEKRKTGDDAKPAGSATPKKMKTDSDFKPTIKEEPSKAGGMSKGSQSTSKPGAAAVDQGPVSEEEIRAVLLQRGPLTASDLVSSFKARLKSREDKKAFADILKRISKIQKNNNMNYVVLRSLSKIGDLGCVRPTATDQGPVSEEEIRAVLLQRAPLTISDLVSSFKARLKSREDKKAFADIMKRISKIQKNNNLNYVVLIRC